MGLGNSESGWGGAAGGLTPYSASSHLSQQSYPLQIQQTSCQELEAGRNLGVQHMSAFFQDLPNPTTSSLLFPDPEPPSQPFCSGKMKLVRRTQGGDGIEGGLHLS